MMITMMIASDDVMSGSDDMCPKEAVNKQYSDTLIFLQSSSCVRTFHLP